MDELHRKYAALQEYLRELGSVAVAFSCGVDSAFLLTAAREILGDKAVAITARSCAFPDRELSEAREFCKERGIRHIVFDTNELELEDYRKNPKNRCYICKRSIFERLVSLAEENGLSAVAEGSNTDDEGDYRPGLQAVAELGVKSPLRAVGLGKAEIRRLSKEMGLPTWEKPSYACLATRFPYGEEITAEKLSMVDKAEQLLMDKGLLQVRVRIHGSMARIELLPEEFDKLLKIREEIVEKFKGSGFTYVSLDLQGYRMGSMNETLDKEDK